MAELVPSLTLLTGAAIVALVSAAAAFVSVRLTSARVDRILGVTVPVVVACVLYWLPVWRGAHVSEFSAWAPLFIVPWSVAGIVAASLVVGLASRRERNRHGDAESRSRAENIHS